MKHPRTIVKAKSLGLNLVRDYNTVKQLTATCKALLLRRLIIGASYTRALGDGASKFEPWLSERDDTLAGTLSPNYHTTLTGGRLSSGQI
ncbi:hypothetical protein TNCV_2089061 [Trichonephila clavipes]|nr:hypothetical protein TNCV_2089061 [Trichonephila clavipes]